MASISNTSVEKDVLEARNYDGNLFLNKNKRKISPKFFGLKTIFFISGFTALHLAVQRGSYECVEELLRADVDINDRDGCSGYTALHHAVGFGRKAIVALLVMQVHVTSTFKSFEVIVFDYCY